MDICFNPVSQCLVMEFPTDFEVSNENSSVKPSLKPTLSVDFVESNSESVPKE